MAASRIAVVGGGLAGLAAAVDLKEAGYAVELFERSRLIGGRATSFEIDGHEVDNGQHVFLACCTEFMAFARRVGMGDALRLQERFEVLVFARDGSTGRLRAAPLPAPFHLLVSLLRYRYLGWGAKLRLARAVAGAPRAAHANGSFAAWLAQTGQRNESLRAFWEPFFVPALNAPLDEVSAAEGAFILNTAFLHDAGAARFGFTTVPLARVAQAAARRLDAVHMSTPVRRIELSADGSRFAALHTQGERLAFDGVVLALTPPQLSKLLGEAPLRVPGLEAFAPHAIVDVHLWHDRGRLSFDFAALIGSAVQWVFEKGDGYLCASLSAADGVLAMTTAELTQLCWDELRATIPALNAATLVRSAVTRNVEATFVAPPGSVRPAARTALPNLTIAGSWTNTQWPDTMESAVRSGCDAARTLMEALPATSEEAYV